MDASYIHIYIHGCDAMSRCVSTQIMYLLRYYTFTRKTSWLCYIFTRQICLAYYVFTRQICLAHYALVKLCVFSCLFTLDI